MKILVLTDDDYEYIVNTDEPADWYEFAQDVADIINDAPSLDVEDNND